MNKKLEDKLKKKYPELLTRLDKKDPNYSCFDRDGLCIGDGWYELFDRVCRQIQYYNENPPWVEEKFAWIKKLYLNTLYYPIISMIPVLNEILHVRIKSFPDTKHEKIRFRQVKEKFGSMRIYHSPYSRYISGVLAMAESISNVICENCGTTENVTQNYTGWTKTYCNNCRKKLKR